MVHTLIRMRPRRLLCLLIPLAGSAAAAHAHTGGRAFILLLPTQLYIVGGAIVVAASFALIALIPSEKFAKVEAVRKRLGVLNRSRGVTWLTSVCPSLVSLLLMVFLLVAGYWGSRDPLSNPLPLFFWTVWWIGFTYLHAVFGNLWIRLNPWSGLYRLVTSLGQFRKWWENPPVEYPSWAGYWPAVVIFLAFAWFELIYPSSADPSVLARVVFSYLVVNFVGIFLFGERSWLQYGEAFSVFFRVISWLSPLRVSRLSGACKDCETECRSSQNCLNCVQCQSGPDPKGIHVTVPTLKLLSVRPLRVSAVFFVLLVLSSVSFDGMSRTFFWLGLIGVNPLEYPGRTILMIPNSAGLVGVFAALLLAYVAVLFFAKVLSGSVAGAGQPFGVLVLSIVPIAFGYHFAHYLPDFMVDIQYALRSVSDPLGLGWDIFGTRNLPIIASFLTDALKAYAVWDTQIIIIVGAHIAAVYLAHVCSLRLTPSPKMAIVSQIPMTLLMIGYTMFGLWLLSTPAV